MAEVAHIGTFDDLDRPEFAGKGRLLYVADPDDSIGGWYVHDGIAWSAAEGATAARLTISDQGGYYTTKTAEAALQQLGPHLHGQLGSTGDMTISADTGIVGTGDVVVKAGGTERLRISNAGDLTVQTLVDGTFQGGGHYLMPAGSQAFRINHHGDVIFGPSYLVPDPTNISTRHAVGTFWSQQQDRLYLRAGLTGSMIGDPFDINGRRYGPENGYPWGKPANAIGAYTDLTAVDSGSTIMQLRATVVAAPYGGDHTTPGATDPGAGTTLIGWRTTELGRDITGNQDYAGGNKIRISVVPNGVTTGLNIVDFNPQTVLIGAGAINAGDQGDLLQLRTPVPINEVKKLIVQTGTPTSGTFKIGVWSVAPDVTGKTPTDGASYATVAYTAAIPWNAAASAVQAALDALIGAGKVVATGGPLPGSQITLTYSGAAVAGVHMNKLTIDNTSLVGGTYSSSRQTEGFPGGASQRLLYMRHVAGSDGTQPDASYLIVQRGDGTTMLELDRTGVLKVGGQSVGFTAQTNSDNSVVMISGKVTGDTQARFLLRTAGTMEWGAGGVAASDIEFARQSAGLMRLRGFGPATATKLVLQMVETALTGTVAATNGSAAVVGTSTHFTTEINEGTVIRIENAGAGSGTYTDFTVSSIADDTHLTLTANFTGTTGSGLAARSRTQGPTGTDVFSVQDANGNVLARIGASGAIRSAVGLGTRHEAAATPTQGASGDIRVGTGLIWINDAGTWKSVAVGGATPAGTELAYAQRTTGINITATTSATADDAGIDSGAVTYDGSAVIVEFFTPQLSKGTSSITIVLYDGATELGQMGANTAGAGPVTLRTRITPSAGSHDYKIKAFVNAGTGQINAGAGTIGTQVPAFIRITKA